MATAYTPGLKVSAQTRHSVRRLLPIAGDVLVRVGDRVKARQVVAETFMPGDVTPLNMANLLAMPPVDVPDSMLKREGARIELGEVLARTKGIFGMFRSEYASTLEGTIETISTVTGQVIVRGEPLPLQVRAYLTGTVVEIIPSEGCIIEADVSFIQGIFGIGGEAFGPIRMGSKSPDQELTEDMIGQDMEGCVVVGGSRIIAASIQKAADVGVSAVVVGGIDDEDLEKILGYSLGVAITGSERIGLTLIITEGFGTIAMAERTFSLLASRQGEEAAVNGTTQIRAGVMRPEIIIPRSKPDEVAADELKGSAGYLELGMPVRIIRDPYFGLLGSVSALPAEPRVLASGSRARVLEVELKSKERVIIPRANVELIER